jgi:hypothetical protein
MDLGLSKDRVVRWGVKAKTIIQHPLSELTTPDVYPG